MDEGDSIPNNLDEFDAMLCMGGPMDTFMEDQYPWLVAEKKAIGEYVLNLEKAEKDLKEKVQKKLIKGL